MLSFWSEYDYATCTELLLLQVSSITNETLHAVNLAQDSLGSGKVKISTASTSNPGIPPSSLMTFVSKVCEEYPHIWTAEYAVEGILWVIS